MHIKKNIEELKDQLKELITKEEFEKAAVFEMKFAYLIKN